MGASFGGLGRVTGEQWIPAVPLAMDLFWGVKYSSAMLFTGISLLFLIIHLSFVLVSLVIPSLERYSELKPNSKRNNFRTLHNKFLE